MAEINEKSARLMTVIGGVTCLIAVITITLILAGISSLPIFIPLMLLISGTMLIFVSLAYHTKK